MSIQVKVEKEHIELITYPVETETTLDDQVVIASELIVSIKFTSLEQVLALVIQLLQGAKEIWPEDVQKYSTESEGKS